MFCDPAFSEQDLTNIIPFPSALAILANTDTNSLNSNILMEGCVMPTTQTTETTVLSAKRVSTEHLRTIFINTVLRAKQCGLVLWSSKN